MTPAPRTRGPFPSRPPRDRRRVRLDGPPPRGDLPRFESSVFIPALNRSFLLRGVRPTNVPPAVSRDIATVSEELGGTALNRARVLHSGSLDAGGFGAESDADAFVSDLGTAVAFTSDRLDLTAAADSRLGFSFESLTELNLDLAPGQQGFAGVIIDWAFGRIEPSGQTVLSSDTFSAELDTLSGLNPSGTTTRSYALPTDLLTFQLDAGERYFLSVDIVNYRGSCPARRPPRRWRWPL